MNKEWIHFHLTEALEELARTAKQVETDADYGPEDFEVAISHLYHHLNTAWNSRNASEEETSNAGDEDFNKWGQLPSDLRMMTL